MDSPEAIQVKYRKPSNRDKMNNVSLCICSIKAMKKSQRKVEALKVQLKKAEEKNKRYPAIYASLQLTFFWSTPPAPTRSTVPIPDHDLSAFV
jgi:hypothetical protein